MTADPVSDTLHPYLHREVALEAAGRRLSFATSLALFSSHQVDVGTRLLLRTLAPVLAPPPTEAGRRVLDLGCGYGPLGIALAALPGVASAHLVDRDALAVDFARENARRNGVADRVTVSVGLGIEDLPAGERYDLVVSNVPGKAGARPIAALLLDALRMLRPGGLAAVVVIEPIRELVASTLARADLAVTFRRDTADYSVFHYQLAEGAALAPTAPGFATGVYDRAPLAFEDLRGDPVRLDAVEGLRGFDRVDALERLLAERARLPAAARVLITTPGQGALPALLWRAAASGLAQVVLVDRDLLALRTARRALLAVGAHEAQVTAYAVGAWDTRALADVAADLVVGVLHEDGGAAAVEAEYDGLLRAVAPGGAALLGASSTAVTRLLDGSLPPGWQARRTRHRGSSVLEVQAPPR